ECVSVSGAVDEAARLVAHWIVWRVGERAERVGGGIGAGRVHVVLGARCPVLQVVGPAMLGHPSTLDKRCDRRVAMVLTKTLPPVMHRVETEQPSGRALVVEPPRLVELDGVQRIGVR